MEAARCKPRPCACCGVHLQQHGHSGLLLDLCMDRLCELEITAEDVRAYQERFGQQSAEIERQA